jgi:hypothetical protein
VPRNSKVRGETTAFGGEGVSFHRPPGGHDGKTRPAKTIAINVAIVLAQLCLRNHCAQLMLRRRDLGSRGREGSTLGIANPSSPPLFLPRQNHQPANLHILLLASRKCKKIGPSHIISAKHAILQNHFRVVPPSRISPPMFSSGFLLMFHSPTRAEVMTPSSNGLVCTCFVLFPVAEVGCAKMWWRPQILSDHLKRLEVGSRGRE